jgi:uncharacterized protein (DUF2126 family)
MALYLEKSSSTGTSRFVDSSLERFVKVSGLFQTVIYYYAKAVESHKKTGTKGEYVAGIRYKAWNPPSALHPNIGIDVPLVLT